MSLLLIAILDNVENNVLWNLLYCIMIPNASPMLTVENSLVL